MNFQPFFVIHIKTRRIEEQIISFNLFQEHIIEGVHFNLNKFLIKRK